MRTPYTWGDVVSARRKGGGTRSRRAGEREKGGRRENEDGG